MVCETELAARDAAYAAMIATAEELGAAAAAMQAKAAELASQLTAFWESQGALDACLTNAGQLPVSEQPMAP